MDDKEVFEYATAFSRNIGWVTADEQARLRRKRVAIAGLGGVGGFHLLALSRLGIGAFTLAESDFVEIVNFNRQAAATVSTLGRPKLDVLVEMARDVNPELDIRELRTGVTPANAEEFLRGADAYVDGLDFFAFEARSAVFDACARMAIPATTVAPLGMGAALLNFLPGKMTFEDYFGFRDRPDSEKALRFLLGLSPAMLQRRYLVDPTRVNLAEQRGPSTVMACHLCAGIAATEVVKILLGRGKVHAAPVGLHFDAYRGALKLTWRPWGNRNPLQIAAIAMARRLLAGPR